MANNIVTTAEAQNWFFYQVNENSRDPYSYFRLAVWATYDNGETIGLLSINREGTFYLAPPPEGVKGGYIHWEELNTEQQKEAILQGKLAGTSHSASTWK